MDEKRIICVFKTKDDSFDVDIPINISANELIFALNKGYNLGMDISDLSQCYLQCENPIALLRGNKKIEDFGLIDGTIIYFTA